MEPVSRQAALDETIAHSLDKLAFCSMQAATRGECLNSLATALLARFWQSGSTMDLKLSAKCHYDAVKLLPASHGHHSRCIARQVTHLLSRVEARTDEHEDSRSLMHLADRAHERFKLRGNPDDLETAIRLRKKLLALVPSSHMFRALIVDFVALGVNDRFLMTHNIHDLEEVIQLNREALRSGPHDRSLSLQNLATSLHTRFEEKGDIKDVDEAIEIHHEALQLRPSPHPKRDVSLSDLGDALGVRFEQRGNIQDMEESIRVYREALALRPAPHPDRGRSVGKLATALDQRYDRLGNPRDDEKALLLHREALALFPFPHPDRGATLLNLAQNITDRFRRSGKSSDLDEAIELEKEALVLRPTPHPKRGSALDQLAASLQSRFKLSGDVRDIDNAVAMHREALILHAVPHPDRDLSLNNLATALETRSKKTSNADDLDEAIRLHSEAISLRPSPHPDRASSLSNLAGVIHHRFRERGRLEDIDRAILLYREALALHPPPRPSRGPFLNNLAFALQARFDSTGNRDDIAEAIQLLRENLLLLPPSHSERASSLSNLAIALQHRFNQQRDRVDLQESIQLHRAALELVPAPHFDRSGVLSNLATALQDGFGEQTTLQEIDEVALLHKEALSLRPPPDPERGSSLSNVASVLITRFNGERQMDSLEEAISLLREALVLFPASNPGRPSSLDNLAFGLEVRFEHAREVSDIQEALRLHRESLALVPPLHSGRARVLVNLGRCLLSQHDNVPGSNSLDEAMSCLEMASSDPSYFVVGRFNSAKYWANSADQHNHSSALAAYKAALSLLPQVAAFDLDVQSRQKILLATESNGLGCRAAACAVKAGDYDLAVELLEAGRSVFWAQALHLRTPFNELRGSDPEMADKLARLSKELEQGSFRDASRNLSTDSPQSVMLMEAEGNRLRHLQEDWNEAVKTLKIKNPELGTFMEPKRMQELSRAAIHGPVVILNAVGDSCHALVVHPSDTTTCVPLPALSWDFINFLAELVQALSGSAAKFNSFIDDLPGRGSDYTEVGQRLIGKMVYAKRRSPDERFRALLAALWEAVARPVIQSLRMQRSETPPRLWWCPTGPFAFLPLHAAGIYHGGDLQSVSDYVVSSYTPTLSALLVPDRPNKRLAPPKVTAIIQPTTPGYSSLHHTTLELQKIVEAVPKEWLIGLDTSEGKESLETVLFHLATSSIVHFACHGVQDTRNPLESRLLIGGTRLSVSQIMKTSGISQDEDARLGRGLAFLSACETAMGDAKLPDESMHLAATLLFARFSGVVATMWTMFDPDGPRVVETFYGHLFRDQNPTADPSCFPDLNEAARALHLAVIRLRSEVSFARWVPFVHYGL